jgi:hypothetical protein
MDYTSLTEEEKREIVNACFSVAVNNLYNASMVQGCKSIVSIQTINGEKVSVLFVRDGGDMAKEEMSKRNAGSYDLGFCDGKSVVPSSKQLSQIIPQLGEKQP